MQEFLLNPIQGLLNPELALSVIPQDDKKNKQQSINKNVFITNA